MNNIQEEALLKAYAMANWTTKSASGLEDLYYCKKTIQTAIGAKTLIANFRCLDAQTPCLKIQCIREEGIKSYVYPFPITSKTTAVETFLLATNILLQAEKRFGE